MAMSLSAGTPDWGRTNNGGINHVDEGDLCLERFCEIDADVSGMRGERALVQRDENSLEAHLSLLKMARTGMANQQMADDGAISFETLTTSMVVLGQ